MSKRRTYVRDWHGRFSTVAAAKKANQIIEAHKTPPQPADTNIPLWMKTLQSHQAAQTEAPIPRHRYSGKTMILYHRTSAEAAQKIRDKGFNNVTVFASTKPSGDANSYGKSVITLEAPRKHVAFEEPAAEGERWVSVNPRHTRVVKNRRRKR